MIIHTQSILERLENDEFRAAYGAEALTYTCAAAVVYARTRRGWTRRALAARAGVSPAWIARVERGEANPTLRRIGALLACMGLQGDLRLQPLLGQEEREIFRRLDDLGIRETVQEEQDGDDA